MTKWKSATSISIDAAFALFNNNIQDCDKQMQTMEYENIELQGQE